MSNFGCSLQIHWVHLTLLWGGVLMYSSAESATKADFTSKVVCFYKYNLLLLTYSTITSLWGQKAEQRDICSIHQNETLTDRSPTIALFPRAICSTSVGKRCWLVLPTVPPSSHGNKLGDDLMQDGKRQHPILFYINIYIYIKNFFAPYHMGLFPLSINNTLEH